MPLAVFQELVDTLGGGSCRHVLCYFDDFACCLQSEVETQLDVLRSQPPEASGAADPIEDDDEDRDTLQVHSDQAAAVTDGSIHCQTRVLC